MPTSRTRRTRARDGLDPYMIEQLRDGPDAVLLAGVGYLKATPVGSFDRSSPADQAAILQRMREDWNRSGAELREMWGPQVQPWAATAFADVPAGCSSVDRVAARPQEPTDEGTSK